MKGQFIYKIVNINNGKFYVGSTINTRERFRVHRKRLRKGNHHCHHLQAAWNKYGEKSFVFLVIETIPEDQSLQEAEDKWLIEWVGKFECYNLGLRSGAPWRGTPKEKHPSFGRSVPPEQRAQTSEALKAFYAADINNHPRLGKKHSPETRAKISAAIQGKVPSGEAHYLYGKTRTNDVRTKIGDTQRGVKKAPRTISEEGTAKIRAAAEAGHYSHWNGRKHSQESREKMSKRVLVKPDGIVFPSLTKTLEHYGIKMPTLIRALKTGKPISKGRLAGYSFEYVQQTD